MSKTSLSEWLQYLEELHPKTIDLSLDRIKPIAEKLSLIRFSCPVVAVAGTNGKGSTVTFLQKIAEAHDYRVAVYTSPHLLQFNERIVIAGQMVSDAELIKAFQYIESVRQDIALTYFEFTTLAALWLFKQQEQALDLIILEVGMGGRLDAVNIVENNVAVITSIDLDHTEWLGNTREQIGYEKAGILKKNALAIYGGLDVPDTVLQQARFSNTALFVLKRDYDFYQYPNGKWSLKSPLQYWEQLPKTQLLTINAASALMVFELLRPIFLLRRERVESALKQACLSGRYQLIAEKPDVFVDIAHNREAVSMLAQRLKDPSYVGKTRAVFSMLKDKAILECLSEIKDLIDEWFVAPLPVARSYDTNALKKAFFKAKVDMIHWHDDIQDAFQAAMKHSTKIDRVIVFGSFYTVANVMV